MGASCVFRSVCVLHVSFYREIVDLLTKCECSGQDLWVCSHLLGMYDLVMVVVTPWRGD